MLKKSFIILLSTLFISTVVEAKEVEIKQLKKIYIMQCGKRQYGGDDGDIANGIVALENGDSALVGTCKSFGAQAYRYLCYTYECQG